MASTPRRASARLISFAPGGRAKRQEAPAETQFDKSQFLIHDYFYIYSEAHRQRPTIVRFPIFVVHTATFYDATDRPRRQFQSWLAAFLGEAWERREGADSNLPSKGNRYEPFSKPFLDAFARSAPLLRDAGRGGLFGNGRDAASTGGEDELFFEARHKSLENVVVRVEAHREYFSVTMFCPLHIASSKDGVVISAQTSKGEIKRSWSGEAFRQGATGPLAFLYDDVGRAMFPEDNAFDPANPLHCLIAEVSKKFPKATFANFRGAIVDYRTLGDFRWPDIFAQWQDPKREDINLAHAEYFLRDQKEHFRHSVFKCNDDDVVGCYFQGGRTIYLSSLGSQESPDSRDELRYVILYEDVDDPNMPSPPDQGHAQSNRYRLSRLAYRINAIGTLRVAAMRDLHALRTAGVRLREIEARLERVAREQHFGNRDRALMNVIADLESLSLEKYGGAEGQLKPSALFHRTARARHYYTMMTGLVGDLNEVPIANWQTYSQFVHRRLASTFDYVSRLGQRALDLWTLARSRAEFVESRAMLKLEAIATFASALVAPLAFLTALREAGFLRIDDGPTFAFFYILSFAAWLALLQFVFSRTRRVGGSGH